MISVEIRANKIVEGKYKRPSGGARQIKLLCHATFVRDGRGYVLATNLSSGALIAARVDAFWARGLSVSDADEPDDLDLSKVYVTVGSGAFGFVELLEEPELIEWAKTVGGVPITDLLCESVVCACAD